MFRAHFFDAVDDRSSIIVAIGDSHSVHRHQTFLLLERNAYSDQKLPSMSCGSTKLFSRDRDGIGWPSIPVRSTAALSLSASESEYDQRSPAGIVKAIIPTFRQQNPFSLCQHGCRAFFIVKGCFTISRGNPTVQSYLHCFGFVR
jgi:hypothetical protein